MGFASLFEDILDRYYSPTHSTASTASVAAAASRQAIEAFCAEYERRSAQERRLRDLTGSFLGRVDALIETLKQGAALLRPDPTVSAGNGWQQLEASRRAVLDFFASSDGLQFSTLEDQERLRRELLSWRDRATRLRGDVRPVLNSLDTRDRERLARLSSQIEADVDRYIHKSRELQTELTKAWEAFRTQYRARVSLLRRRPTLQHLDPWLLDDQQAALAAHDFSGVMTLHGTSGSGKTIVLLHRALREARRPPGARVLLLARQEPLVHRLREAAAALSGGCAPSNLRIDTVHDLWHTVVGKVIGERDRYRLRDGTSRGATERTSPDEPDERLNSWLQFVRYTPTSPFSVDREVRRLRQNLTERITRPFRTDIYLVADRYLYEEISYIRSAFPRKELPTAYLNMDRVGRSIPLQESQRQVCYRLLLAWDEWLRAADLSDLVGLTWRAADFVLNEATRESCRAVVGAEHILVDELQDLSTLDLSMIRALGRDPDNSPNAFCFAGDLEQKGSYLHLDHRIAGFSLSGRVRHLRRNYRNTREILRAAYEIVSHPEIGRYIRRDPDLEIRDPEFSVFSGPAPVVVPCSNEELQAFMIVRLVQDRRALDPSPAITVVSQSAKNLMRLENEFANNGVPITRIWGTDDRDQYLSRPEMARDRVVLGPFDAVRGLEFDTVIVADLSEDLVPHGGVEPWRNAARLYSTVTRARDELVMTFVGRPSGFVSMMDEHIQWIETPGHEQIARVLAALSDRTRG